MRTVQDLWNTFSERFSNFPMQFNDEIVADGLTTAWELTFYPLSDLTTNPALVLKNTGTFAAPVWTILTENIDFTLDYTTGQLKCTIAPAAILNTEGENTVAIKVVAYHVKINLRQFIQFWNEVTGQMAIYWPVLNYVKVLGSNLGLTEQVSMSELDLSLAYWQEKNILEIYQNESDTKHVLFERR